jgi:tRNA (cmo5U34)-methyltransferase
LRDTVTTNVKPRDLNYHAYAREKYDGDIKRAIPGYGPLHEGLARIFAVGFKSKSKILELGVGTGITAEVILGVLPYARYSAVDFSDKMLEGARERLSGYEVNFLKGDYSVIPLPRDNDAVVSVIGIHHQQSAEDKKSLFARICSSLSDGGVFLFADLMTFRDPEIAALNEALHFHHLVENASDPETLTEWAHHHKFLNSLAPMEDQIDWLKEAGFSTVEVLMQKFNTVLLLASLSPKD